MPRKQSKKKAAKKKAKKRPAKKKVVLKRKPIKKKMSKKKPAKKKTIVLTMKQVKGKVKRQQRGARMKQALLKEFERQWNAFWWELLADNKVNRILPRFSPAEKAKLRDLKSWQFFYDVQGERLVKKLDEASTVTVERIHNLIDAVLEAKIKFAEKDRVAVIAVMQQMVNYVEASKKYSNYFISLLKKHGAPKEVLAEYRKDVRVVKRGEDVLEMVLETLETGAIVLKKK